MRKSEFHLAKRIKMVFLKEKKVRRRNRERQSDGKGQTQIDQDLVQLQTVRKRQMACVMLTRHGRDEIHQIYMFEY